MLQGTYFGDQCSTVARSADWSQTARAPVCFAPRSYASFNLSSLSVPIWEMGMIMTYITGLLWELKELVSIRRLGQFLAHSTLSMCYYYYAPCAKKADLGLTFKDERKTESGAQILEPTVSQPCGPCSSPHSGPKATCTPKNLKVH